MSALPEAHPIVAAQSAKVVLEPQEGLHFSFGAEAAAAWPGAKIPDLLMPASAAAPTMPNTPVWIEAALSRPAKPSLDAAASPTPTSAASPLKIGAMAPIAAAGPTSSKAG